MNSVVMGPRLITKSKTKNKSKNKTNNTKKRKNKISEDIKFSIWIDKIDSIIKKMSGCNLSDFPDQPYGDMFVDGYDCDTVVSLILFDYYIFLL